MNKDFLKSLIQKSNISIDLHPTIEANKGYMSPPQPQRAVQQAPQPQRVVQQAPQPQRAVQQAPQPQRAVQQAPQPQRVIQQAPQPQRVVQQAPQPQRVVQQAPQPQRAVQQAPQPQRVIQQAVQQAPQYTPFNEAPILNTGQVAQREPQRVAQSVAQGSLVAQEAPKMVAQNKPKQVAQITIADKDVEILKEHIFKIDGVEARKKFVKEIGWGILTERRGKKYYLFGAKKIDGKKYKLYIGNAAA